MARVSVAPRKSARLQAARRDKKSGTTQKPRKSATTKATTTYLTTQQEDSFPFLSLPAEIQLSIFNMIFSHRPNHVLRKTAAPVSPRTHVKKRSMTWVRTPHDASQFLLACRTIHKDFAPLYWQRSTVRFTDPVKLANEFLAFASPTAMANLSHLHYTVNTDGYEHRYFVERNEAHIATRVREVRKLAETVSLYRELKGLQSFQVEVTLSPTLQQLARTVVSTGFDNRIADRTWKGVDVKYRGCFEELENKLPRKTLRDFKIEKTIVETNPGGLINGTLDWREVRPTALRMTFTKIET